MPTMDPFENLFQHLPEYRVVVCRECQYAVVPVQINGHVRDQHRHIPKAVRKSIARRAQTLIDVAYTPEEVQYPSPDSIAINSVPVFTDGLRCRNVTDGQRCQYVCREMRVMQRHCQEKHDWINPRQRGGYHGHRAAERSRLEMPWIDQQTCQRFFKAGPFRRYFAVQCEIPDSQAQVDSSSQRSSQPSSQPSSQQRAQAVIQSVAAKRAQRDQDRAVVGMLDRTVANPWLQFTQWPQHLAGYRPEELYAMVSSSEDEGEVEHAEEDNVRPGLSEACKATRRLIKHSFAACKPHIVGRAALEYINRRECGATEQERPFYGEQQVKTIEKYSGHWVKMLRFLWRTADKERRPDYELTPDQNRRLGVLQGAAGAVVMHEGDARQKRKRRQRLIEAVLEFWIAMFDHQLKDREFESGIISGLAVMGLESASGGWMPAMNYTPILAGFITVLRAMVVYRAWRTQVQSIRRAMRDGKTAAQAKQEAPSVYREVQAMVDRFMTLTTFHSQPTPMDRIYHQKTYGMKIRFSTKADGRVAWQGDRILIDRISFTMDDIRMIVHGLNESVRQRLVVDLLGFPSTEQGDSWKPDGMPVFDLKKLFDNHAELSEGWSFIQDSRNRWPVEGTQWMWERLFENDTIRRQFITAAEPTPTSTAESSSSAEPFEWSQSTVESIEWSQAGVERYLRSVRRFKEELMTLVHMSAGAPARATELISIQHENGPQAQSQRGVFIDDGMVAFVTAYHKGFGLSQRVKVVHRYVPREVGEIVVYYLWLVGPFVRSLQAAARDHFETSPWIWEPQPEQQWAEAQVDEGDEADDAEQDDRTGEGDDGGSDWSDDGDAWLDGITAVAAPAVACNSDGFWDTDRVRRVMYRETESRIGVRIGVALWRNAYPAIQRELCKDQEVQQSLDAIYGGAKGRVGEVATAVEDIQAKQSGHSRQMEEMIYGLLLTASPFATLAEQAQFRRVSVDWHRLLRFQSSWEDHKTSQAVQQRVRMEQKEAQEEQWQRMRRVDVAAQLARFHGPDATFRGIQRAALDAIVAGAPRVLVVMRTGGGKSMMFTLPAAGSEVGVTVVIVPTVSLRQDLQERCDRAKIPCAEWNGRRPPYHARIVLVTPESAVSLAFGRFIDEKRTMYQLERIVIDECHVILESNEKWRPRVLELSQMAQKDVQVLYLTATLPPSEEPAFFNAVGVAEDEMVQFREATTRSNVEYRVVDYDRENEDEEVRELVEKMKEKYAAPGQIVIYCKRVVQAQHLGEVLNCSVYHRNVGSVQQKKGILRKLTGQVERVFTATNALGLGVDAPCIRAVIHVGIREKIKQYAQESGRAGRDGQASEAIIMRATWKEDGKKRMERGYRTEAAMKAFLSGSGCRRIPLDRHMDGRSDRLGCEPGDQRCDICRGEPRGARQHRIMVRFVEGGSENEEVSEDDGVDDRQDCRHGGVQDAVPEEEEDVEGASAPAAKRPRMEEEGGAVEQGPSSSAPIRELIEREMLAQRQIQHRHRQRRVSMVGIAETIDGQLQRWAQRCSICQVQQRTGGGQHGWRECGQCSEADRRMVEKAWKSMGEIVFAPYAHCSHCWAPQAVCHSWEDISHGGPQRYRRRKDGECQHRGVLREAAATVLAFQSDQVGDWIDQQAASVGLVESGEDDLWTIWAKWFGQKIRYEGIEMSGLCRLVHEATEVDVSIC